MFDSLRRAEASRKRKLSRPDMEPDKPTIEPVRPEVDRPRRTVDVGQLDGFPASFLGELGMLKNSLESATGGAGKRSILFASSTPGEGTTTIVSSFAKLLSIQTDERVLLVEMNARKPALHWRLGLNSQYGITHFLDGRQPLEAITQPTPQGTFDVVHVGESDPVKIQVNLDQTFPQFLQTALQRYDTVLVDAPPVIKSPEVPPMASAVDGVVIVVRAGKTKREIVQRSLEMIGQFEGQVLGLVLNRKKYYIPDFIYRRL
jgi:Mrp family chromosome partitioning ATPase